jgi:two-component system, chemotaxis family, response regulator Rcp1
MSSLVSAKTVQIFIVEDNFGDVLLVREALKESSLRFELQHAADGEEAIQAITKDRIKPDLVLLDINLPKRDGWEVLDELRSNAETRNVPVVVLSSSGSPEDRDRASRNVPSIYIQKPTNLDDFLAVGKTIEAFLRANE